MAVRIKITFFFLLAFATTTSVARPLEDSGEDLSPDDSQWNGWNEEEEERDEIEQDEWDESQEDWNNSGRVDYADDVIDDNDDEYFEETRELQKAWERVLKMFADAGF